MPRIKFPSIKALGKELSGIRQNVEFTTDVYLVVYDNGQWAVTFEMPRSVTTIVVAWARYFLPGYRTTGRFNGREVASDMIKAAHEIKRF